MSPVGHTKILYGLIAVLFVALGVVLYQNEQLQTATMNATQQGTSNIPRDVVVGSGNADDTVVGIITSDTGGTLLVQEQDGSVKTVAITSDTTFTIAGKLKDQATFAKELDVYNAQVTELMKDPERNKAALAAMQLPPAQEVTPATASDFKVGDAVVISTSGANRSGAYTALTVTKNSPTKP